ncbi:hypothetical protein [uncultured Mobiluncus sp.]|nr:hypothetical protein [uncultured Mobiluncus sp.]
MFPSLPLQRPVAMGVVPDLSLINPLSRAKPRQAMANWIYGHI